MRRLGSQLHCALRIAPIAHHLSKFSCSSPVFLSAPAGITEAYRVVRPLLKVTQLCSVGNVLFFSSVAEVSGVIERRGESWYSMADDGRVLRMRLLA